MSQSKFKHEAERWWKTAKEDLEAAKILKDYGKYSQACFLCQQSAEKSVKAMWFFIGEDPWGHSVQKLLMEFPKNDTSLNIDELVPKSSYLDKFYIPTRYPNGLPDLTPGQVYTEEEAQLAIQYALFFLDIAHDFIGYGII
ncbi:MAG: HEPN domain-containing protein [Candidatus Kryptoniota bacterium]